MTTKKAVTRAAALLPPLAAPGNGYRPAQRMEWIDCEEPGLAGFRILVRTSITNAEKADLTAAHEAIVRYEREEWRETPPEKRDFDDSPGAREERLLAPHIHGWNVLGLTKDGEEKPVPPPAEAGPEAFRFVGPDEIAWMTNVVLIGYAVLGKAVTWSRPRATSPDPSATTASPATPIASQPDRAAS